MSLLRIIFGVLVGVGFFVGLGFLAQRFPAAARYVGLCFIFFFPPVLSAWTIRYCLRVGEVKSRWTPRYQRSTSHISRHSSHARNCVLNTEARVMSGARGCLAPDSELSDTAMENE